MRHSKTKEEIIKILSKSSSPLDAVHLTKKIGVNKTTIYRDLENLLKENKVDEIEFGDGKKRYEVSSRNHHHHLVCKNCGKIEDVKIEEKIFLTKISNQTNFKIENHSIEFFGRCFNCQL